MYHNLEHIEERFPEQTVETLSFERIRATCTCCSRSSTASSDRLCGITDAEAISGV